EDVRTDPAFLGAIAGIVSEICVPLRDQNQVVGILNVESTQGVILSEADLQLMVALSEQVNIAIGRARLYTKLQENERMLAPLMSNLPGMAYRCWNDRNWTSEFVSEGCFDLTGYRPADLIGDQGIFYAQLIHPDDREQIWNEVQAAVR